MIQIVASQLARALAVPALVLSLLVGFSSGAHAAGVGGARCHCPCAVQCGGGVSCNCSGHGETCAKCSCGSAHLEAKDISWLAESASVEPVLGGYYAPWFSFEPHGEIQVALEATLAEDGTKDTFPIRFVLESRDSLRYVPDIGFRMEELRGWLRRVDSKQSVTLYAAAKDDPATYAILDGDRSHLNESLRKGYSIRFGDGPWRSVFTSDATLTWEMIVYLKSAVAQLPEEAFLGDAGPAKGRLYDAIETLDLMLQASSYDAALRVVEGIVEGSEALGLNPAREEAVAAVCAFRKMGTLLSSGKSVTGTE